MGSVPDSVPVSVSVAVAGREESVVWGVSVVAQAVRRAESSRLRVRVLRCFIVIYSFRGEGASFLFLILYRKWPVLSMGGSCLWFIFVWDKSF